MAVDGSKVRLVGLAVLASALAGFSGCAQAPTGGGSSTAETVPNALVVGDWTVGPGATEQKDAKGESHFATGVGQSLSIRADGTFAYATLANTDPALNGYFFNEEGTIRTAGSRLVLDATYRTGMVRHEGEKGWERGDNSGLPPTRSFAWRIDPNNGFPRLCLTPEEGAVRTETCLGKHR